MRHNSHTSAPERPVREVIFSIESSEEAEPGEVPLNEAGHVGSCSRNVRAISRQAARMCRACTYRDMLRSDRRERDQESKGEEPRDQKGVGISLDRARASSPLAGDADEQTNPSPHVPSRGRQEEGPSVLSDSEESRRPTGSSRRPRQLQRVAEDVRRYQIPLGSPSDEAGEN